MTALYAAVLTAVVIVLGTLTAAAPPVHASPSSEEASATPDACVDGGSAGSGQMYAVDCSRMQGFESDNECAYDYDTKQVECQRPTGIDSNTSCLYGIEHTPDGTLYNHTIEIGYWSEVTAVSYYETGPCPLRDGTTDSSTLCAARDTRADGRDVWVTGLDCPTNDPTAPTACLDGPNDWGQPYTVACSRMQGFESNNVCRYSAGSDYTCTKPSGVDSSTRCLYQFDHGVNNNESTIVRYWLFEIGPCPPRDGTTDPNPYCMSRVVTDGPGHWVEYKCPTDEQPPTPTPTHTPAPEPPPPPAPVVAESVLLNITDTGPLTSTATSVRVTAQTSDGEPWKGIAVDVCAIDQVTQDTSCATVTTNREGIALGSVSAPRHGTVVTASHAATERTLSASTSRVFTVRTSVNVRVDKSRRLQVTSYPQVATTFKVQRKTGNGWKKTRTVRSNAKGRAVIKGLSGGKYRVLSVGADGRLPSSSKTVTVRRQASQN